MKLYHNEDKSTASVCRQVAAWVPVMFCKFYLVINHKIADKPKTAKAIGEKNKHRFGIVRILLIFWHIFHHI
jgi:hypothetical protein